MSDNAKSNWPELAADLFGKLTNLSIDMSYDFENLEIEMPQSNAAAAPAKWRINGKLRISTKGNRTDKNLPNA